MKKFLCLLLATVCILGILSISANAAPSFNRTKRVVVVTREDGSGTKGAFVELFGVQRVNKNGVKVDAIYKEAIVCNSTSVVLATVAKDMYAIGYVSLGSLNDTVKAVKINGVAATTANVKNGKYEVKRPFNIATKGAPNALAQDFINFILSAEGQAVAEKNGYVSEGDKGAYKAGAANLSGKLVVAGSSSVTPLMEKLKEAYAQLNPNVTIEIQMSDSSMGMTATADGLCDIGMASRELKDSETAKGLRPITICQDGIAIIVSNSNPIEDLTIAQVKSVFLNPSRWSALSK